MSIIALDFFFVPPLYRLAVEQARNVVTFSVMLLVAVAVSRRTVRMREQADSARERERRTAALFGMSRELSVEDEPVSIAEVVIRHVRNLFDCDAAVFLRSDGGLSRLAGDASGVLSSEREIAVGRWVFDHGRPAGRGTDTLPASRALFLPLVGSSGTIGVFGIELGERPEDLSPSQHQILETFVAQTALALERVILSGEASRARIAAETEGLRSSLLSAVSHDLRTPLASITGSAQALLDDSGSLTPESRRELLENVRGEGDRLGRLVSNLLDLTRVESGTLAIKEEWCPIDEIVHSAIGRLEAPLSERSLVVDLPDDVLMVPGDPVLLEQTLVNLIENAIKFSGPGTPIEVRARGGRDGVEIEVSDRGRGIPEGDEARIFEKFYRVGSLEGAGLGLAVVHAITKAHKGSIVAENRPGGGATFRLRLPIEGSPPAVGADQGAVA